MNGVKSLGIAIFRHKPYVITVTVSSNNMIIKHSSYLASSLLKLIESSRITRRAFIPDSFPKLGEVDEVSPDAAFVAEDPREESDDREGTDDCVGEA